MGTFDIVQICLNGHVITEMAGSHPELKNEFCFSAGLTDLNSEISHQPHAKKR